MDFTILKDATGDFDVEKLKSAVQRTLDRLIIEDMSKRSFRKFDFDILGNTYETYLGHTLHLKEYGGGTFDLKPSQETRKESGIYYTPPYVVDYIVKNTLGVLLLGKTPEPDVHRQGLPVHRTGSGYPGA